MLLDTRKVLQWYTMRSFINYHTKIIFFIPEQEASLSNSFCFLFFYVAKLDFFFDFLTTAHNSSLVFPKISFRKTIMRHFCGSKLEATCSVLLSFSPSPSRYSLVSAVLSSLRCSTFILSLLEGLSRIYQTSPVLNQTQWRRKWPTVPITFDSLGIGPLSVSLQDWRRGRLATPAANQH